MTTAMPPLETALLQIRPCEMADLEALRRVHDIDAADNDTKSPDQLTDRLGWSVANYEQLARLYQPPYGDRAVVLRESGDLIGLCGLVPCLMNFEQIPEYAGKPVTEPVSRTIPEVGLYYHIAGSHRRQGHASEAAQALVDYGFDVLNLRRIVATTENDNAGSVGVMRRLGMRIGRNPFPEPFWLQVVGILDNPAYGL